MEQPLKILHLEDVEEDSLVVGALLRQNIGPCALSRVDTLEAFRKELQDPAYDLVLMDFTLPGLDALSTLALARRTRPELPVVLLTGTLGEERAVECLKKGAMDFVLKSNLKRLPLAVRRALEEAGERRARVEADERLAQTLQHLSDMKGALDESALVKIVDPVRRITTYVNDAYPACTGYSREELLGTAPDLRSRELHPPEFFQQLWDTISLGMIWKGEVQHPKKEGGALWLDMTIVPFLDSQGCATQYLSIGFDITDRKVAEAALLEKTSELDRFFTQDIVLLCIADLEGRFKRLSRTWERTLGYRLEELEGHPSLDFVHPEDQEDTRAAGRTLVAGKELRDFVNRYRCKDGSYRWIEWCASTSGSLIYAQARDITEQRLWEEKLVHLNAELERRVKERTSQLEQSNRELEAFSYSVSHDLRAPLRHIDGFLDLLAEQLGTDLDPKATRYCDVIKAACVRMNRLIEDLLRFSRLGQQELDRIPLDLGPLVAEVVKELGTVNGGRKVVWRIGSLPRIQGDPALMRVVFANLLENAVKFTRNQPEALIEVGCLDSGSGDYRIFIRDNGVGFDMQYAGKLFTVFHRLHSHDEFEGSGIGLANVQRIIQRHNGQIWAEAVPGQGATFTFSLPRE